LEKPHLFGEVITINKKMFSIFQYIESIAQTSQPVLITGETGTGKELIAKAIHRASGRKGDLVAVNVAGLDDNMFSDTLFGHVKGAFTGATEARRGLVEKAAGGTLMLDEIGDLSVESQVKLLRFLQEGEYFPLGKDEPMQTQVRVVAVTNKDLFALKQEGRFRKDLYFRLQTHRIHIPPLRDRMEDIPLLAEHFLQTAAKALNKKKPTVPSGLPTLLATYSFAGNIRELEAMMFDALSRHKSGVLSLDVFKTHLAKELGDRLTTGDSLPRETDGIVFPRNLPTIKQMTKLLVGEAMKRANGNQSVAGIMLGISQQALSKRLKQEREQAAGRKS
jgi:DNA-binding NtrC family response regulator